MAPPQWTYLIADLRTNVILDEVPLSAVRFNTALCASGQLSGTWALGEHPSTTRRDPYDLTMPARRVIYALRDGRPMWGGLIWTRRYDSTNQQVTLGCADFWSYFDHRKVLPLLPGAPPADYVAAQAVRFANTDQNTVARRLVQLAQEHAGGNIGIDVDGSLSGIYRDRTWYGYELADVGEALRQLSGVIGGPDIMFDVGSLDHRGRPSRLLRLGDPRLGQQGSAHVWEVGGSAISYTWPSDGTRMTSRAFAAGDGIETGMPVAVAEDPDRYSNGWPLLDTETGYSTVTDPATLREHAETTLHAGRLPVVLPTLTVRGDPAIGTFAPGDDARVIIPPDLFLRDGIDTAMRLVDVALAPDGDGDTAVLTMSPLLDDAA